MRARERESGRPHVKGRKVLTHFPLTPPILPPPGYSITSTSQYASIGFTGRLSTDTLGLMTMGETVVQQGLGAQTGVSRWGDYAAMSIDPTDRKWYDIA